MKNVKKILAILLALSLVLPVFSLTVVATSTGSIDASNETLTTLSEYKEGVAIEKYNTLLKHWAYDKRYPSDEYAAFPSFYGGVYLDDSKNLVIQLTDIDKSNIVYFEKLIDLDDVLFEKVEYSYTNLIAAKDAAVAKMTEANIKYGDTITGIGISVKNNAVNLYINKDDVRSNGFTEQEICNFVSEFDNILIIETSGKDQPAAIVYPGDRLNVEQQSTDYDRSVGFWARNSTGDLGFVTAPHDSIDANDEIYINGVKFGVAGVPIFSGSVDAVFIRRTDYTFTASRYVPGHNVSHVSGEYTMLMEGAYSYSRGRKSGAQVGTVQDTSYTTSYGRTNCVLTSNYCQTYDSGGIVIGRGNAYDLFVAGIVTGRQVSGNNLIYTKANYLLSNLNCTIY